MHDTNRENKIIPEEEMILRPKNFWVWGLEWERKVWKGEETKTIERDRGEMKKLSLYIDIFATRWIGKCWELKFARRSNWVAIKRCPQQKGLNGSKSYQTSIEHTETSLMDQEAIEIESQESRWIEIAITTIEKRSSRGSIDSLVVERYREVVEIA